MIANLFRAKDTVPVTQIEEWPEDMVARFLTAAGRALGDTSLTVDLSRGGRFSHVYQCRGCGAGRSGIPGGESDGRRAAQDHATECTGLPRPEAGDAS